MAPRASPQSGRSAEEHAARRAATALERPPKRHESGRASTRASRVRQPPGKGIPFYGQRHLVKPGLTGWAQVSYRYGSSVDDALQKLQYDLYYLKHMSVVFDVLILIATLRTVWSRTGR